jgi:hypothetical protein
MNRRVVEVFDTMHEPVVVLLAPAGMGDGEIASAVKGAMECSKERPDWCPNYTQMRILLKGIGFEDANPLQVFARGRGS